MRLVVGVAYLLLLVVLVQARSVKLKAPTYYKSLPSLILRTLCIMWRGAENFYGLEREPE